MKVKGRIRRLILVITTMFILTNINVEAMESGIRFKQYTSKDGLSQVSVESILQDSKGYMWFATGDGLNKYDGYEFDVLKYDIDDKNTIPGNYVHILMEDSEGYIWAGTQSGIAKINSETNECIRYNHVEEDNSTIPADNTWRIIEDKDGDVWAGTENGLAKFDKDSKKITVYQSQEDNEKTLSDNFITALHEDENGLIWIGTKNGLNSYDKSTDEFVRYKELDKLLEDSFLTDITSDKEGNIWIGTLVDGLIKLDRNNNFYKYMMEDKKDSLQSNTVNVVFCDSKDNLWIGTEGGLSKYRKDKDDFYTYKKTNYDQDSLVDDSIMSIYEDDLGMIWVGTYNGISMFNPEPKFKYYSEGEDEKSGLNDNMLSGIVEDDKYIWIGTKSGGLNSLEKDSGDVKHYINNPNDDTTISNNRVWGMTEDNEGNLWIATTYGLNVFNKDTKTFKRYLNTEDNKILSSNEIRHIMQQRSGEIWIGTRNGLDLYDKSQDKFINYNHILTDNGFKNGVGYLYEDKSENIWIGSAMQDGLLKYNTTTGESELYKYDENDKESISSNKIYCINEDSEGNIWVATSYGLNKMDINSGKFKRYTEKDGLINNEVYSVLLDEKQMPWLSSAGGISKIDLENDRIINFDITDGLQSNEFNSYSFYKSNDGEMLFGGINGLNSFYPNNLVKNQYDFSLTIKEITNEGKKVENFDDIFLKYNENNIEVKFFVPDYEKADKKEYMYKLEGFDDEWVSNGNRNYILYRNIPDGNYKLKIKALNSEGIWSSEKVINIKVETPPWRSNIAYVIYILGIIVVISFMWNYVKILDNLVRVKTNQLNKKLKENDKLYKKLIEKEQLKNNYFVNLSHELRTPLNVTLSTVQLLDKCNAEGIIVNKNKMEEYLEIIKKNSNRLLNIINDIIDDSKIESGTYVINKSSENIVYIVEDIALTMKNYVEEHGIELIIDPEIEERIIEVDKEEIERCIINLISNATKFTNDGGTIYIRIWESNNTVKISVKDDGIGIEKKHQKKIFERFGQANNSKEKLEGSGIGLTLVKSLVELHNGKIELISEINEGAEFIITLPFQ